MEGGIALAAKQSSRIPRRLRPLAKDEDDDDDEENEAQAAANIDAAGEEGCD